jgi:hypothetical protein
MLLTIFSLYYLGDNSPELAASVGYSPELGQVSCEMGEYLLEYLWREVVEASTAHARHLGHNPN